MPHARGGECGGEPRALLRSAGREACAQPLVARIDAELAARFRVDEPELAQARKLLLARVANLDGEYVVPLNVSGPGAFR